MPDILEDLARATAEAPDAPAFADDYGMVSYATLARRASGFAAGLEGGPVGILAPNGIDWVVADLAVKLAGGTSVPIPGFFSPEQIAHIVADAGVTRILASPAAMPLVAGRGIAVGPIGGIEEAPYHAPTSADWKQIIYTSGTTGRPKGVRLAAGQLSASTDALIDAAAVRSSDHYLSVLPFALLLEQVCGIHVPLRTRSLVRIAAAVAPAAQQGNFEMLAAAAAKHRPTVMVLVPEWLKGWIRALERSGDPAPESLRFVAVGGARVAPALADAGWSRGIPVHEGYGLSECCSVVAVNRPGERRAGTVGRPLIGLDISIDEGEIVVRGSTVTDGYLHGKDVADTWRTGDNGSLDEDGYLCVYGRRDDILVTGQGRNIDPAWIESMILADPLIAQCALIDAGDEVLTAVINPGDQGHAWFDAAGPEAVSERIAGLCSEAPAYARPGQILLISDAEIIANGLARQPAGLDRRRLTDYFAEFVDPDCKQEKTA